MFDKNEYNQKYNKAHYVRIPLDVKVPEYNALKEYCSEHDIGMNTFLRDFIKVTMYDAGLLQKHENDTKKD